MNNSRRRKEILLFAIMLSSATALVQDPKFKLAYHGVFRFLDPLDKAHQKAVPMQRDRNKELSAVQMVVNTIIPPNWPLSDDSWKVWFVLQVAYRMVASGWMADRDPLCLEFVQSMYQMSQGFDLSTPPPPSWLEWAARAPEMLRSQGLFK